MKKFWETTWNAESTDGTWEIIHDADNKIIKLEFWDYTNQDTMDEVLKKTVTIELTYEQYQSLLDFSKQMDKIAWKNHYFPKLADPSNKSIL